MAITLKIYKTCKQRDSLIIKKNNQYSVECQTKIAADCIQTGEFSDSKEEAQDWVEEECWVDSGEGWICNKCHNQIMANLKMHRKGQGLGLSGMDNELEGYDGLDNDLESGIDTVR